MNEFEKIKNEITEELQNRNYYTRKVIREKMKDDDIVDKCKAVAHEYIIDKEAKETMELGRTNNEPAYNNFLAACYKQYLAGETLADLAYNRYRSGKINRSRMISYAIGVGATLTRPPFEYAMLNIRRLVELGALNRIEAVEIGALVVADYTEWK